MKNAYSLTVTDLSVPYGLSYNTQNYSYCQSFNKIVQNSLKKERFTVNALGFTRSKRKCRSASPPSVVNSPTRRPVRRLSRPKIYTPCEFQDILPEFDCGNELVKLLDILPKKMKKALLEHEDIDMLVEVVLDVGRKPVARFPYGDRAISEASVTFHDLDYAASLVGDFGDDNRAGIDGSLHRISAIRNRMGRIIGLTCRVGRAVPGGAEMVRDLVEDGASILVIGPPGVGKTTLIREIARMAANDYQRRTVVIDTSNEIAGDGDIPHECIGQARRMQVPNVDQQHKVMIEAIENHTPQTIIIDEMGTEEEALAAKTIAERGIQLVGTAHGMTVENLIKNPSLEILVGGVQSVTIGDDEARRRKTLKTILERKGPATFACAVEMTSKTECRVHHSLEATVDDILAGRSPVYEVRQLDLTSKRAKSSVRREPDQAEDISENLSSPDIFSNSEYDYTDYFETIAEINNCWSDHEAPIHLYTYQAMKENLEAVLEILGLEKEVKFTNYIGAADVILTLDSELKENQWVRGIAKYLKQRIFVVQKNTLAQVAKALHVILGMGPLGLKSRPSNQYRNASDFTNVLLKGKSSEVVDALEEAKLVIEYIVIPVGQPVELLPRSREVIDQQIKLAESYQLLTSTSGTESETRLQILPLFAGDKMTTICY